MENIGAFLGPRARARLGHLTRRQMLGQAAGIGLAGAMLSSRRVFAHSAPDSIEASIIRTAEDATPAAQPVSGGTLHVALQGDPELLDPTQVVTTSIWKVTEHIYDTLVRLDSSLAPIPGLAESWVISDDATVYTFHLREGVRFHDGTPLTADDVLFTYTRILDPATAAVFVTTFLSVKGAVAFSSGQVSTLEGIKVLDPLTVEITLESPDASFLAVLAFGASCIMSRRFVETHDGDVSQVANGTGPFMLGEYVPSASVSLQKNPTYWEWGLPYLDRIEAIFATNDSTRSGSLIQGSADFIEYVPLRDVDTLSRTNGLKIAGDELNNVRYILFNLLREPFNNLKVRQAIAATIDRAQVIEMALFGHGVAVDTVFAPSFWAGFDHDLPAPDTERAKALLAEAGYSDGFKTTLITYAPFSFLTNAAIVVQEQLKQIGIEIEYSALEPAAMSEALIERDFDLAIASSTAWTDPHSVVFGGFGTGQLGNFASYSNPRVDDLIHQGKAEIDRAARAAIYRELQEIILAELPWVPLYVANQYEAMKDTVHGFVHYPTGSNVSLRATWIDRS